MEENNTFIIDSNIIIYSSKRDYEFVRRWIQNKDIGVSDVSRIEVLGYEKLRRENKDYFSILFKKFRTFPIDEQVILKSIALRQTKNMSLGDSIIAATSLTRNFPLLTANSKDFQHIEDLELIDLTELQDGT